MQVPVGKALLGRVVNTLGEPLDGKGPIKSDASYPVEKIAPGIIKRKSVRQPVQTGIMAIDAMIPIGRGQRELIIGDRSTGKTTICHRHHHQPGAPQQGGRSGQAKASYRPLYCIYVAIGQKQSNVARVVTVLEEAGAMPYTMIISVAGVGFRDEPVSRAVRRCGDGRVVHGQRHGCAHRLRRSVEARRRLPPGVARFEAAVRPRSLSRATSSICTAACSSAAARVDEKYGDGSLTALPIIETQAGDVSAYIPTNVISITDGQIFLETDLFYQGVRPAISVGLSVSRVGSAAQIKAIKQVAGTTQARPRAVPRTGRVRAVRLRSRCRDQGARLDRGKRIVELFKQSQYSPIPVEVQVGVHLGGAERVHRRRAGGADQGVPGGLDGLSDDSRGRPPARASAWKKR